MRDTTQDLVNELSKAAEEERRCITGEGREEHKLLCQLERSGALIRVARGLYAEAEAWRRLDNLERTCRILRSLAWKNPSWVFCGPSAAALYGLEVPSNLLDGIHLVTNTKKREYESQRLIRHYMGDFEAVEIDGVRVTPLERTVFDCIKDIDFVRGLPIADSALRVGKMRAEDLQKRLMAFGNADETKRALTTVGWANEKAANGGESVARAIMIEQGFMVPELQVEIANVIEGGVFYADFFWDIPNDISIVGELDGFEKYVDPQMTGGRRAAHVMADERRRESRISACGIKVVRFSYSEVQRREKFTRLLTIYGVPRGACRPGGFAA